jgi:hypothetical protein
MHIHIYNYIIFLSIFIGAKDKGYENFNSRSYKATAVFTRRKYHINSKEYNTGIYILICIYMYL